MENERIFLSRSLPSFVYYSFLFGNAASLTLTVMIMLMMIPKIEDGG